MEPMKPMEPMRPMEPMKPMPRGEAWWPKDFGEPSSSGRQNDLRYAFFAQARRLVIARNGTTTVYDSGDHHIGGVQANGDGLQFTDQDGTVDLDALQRVD